MLKRPRIIWLESTKSTNDNAARLICELDNLSVVAAKSQSEGRGQGDHKWHSAPGENILASFVLKYPPLTPPPSGQTLLLTEVVTMAVREYILSRGVNSQIKWFNDILVEGRKICGILIENSFTGGAMTHTIAGIGLNINETDFPEDLPNPVSLKQLTGKEYDVATELQALQSEMEKSALLLQSEEGRKSLNDYFREHCFNIPEGH